MPISGLAKWLDMCRPPPATSVVLGDAVEDDLQGGQARGQAGEQVPVVREQVVLPWPEAEAQGQLDAVVAGAGGVVGPADGLLEVVGRLVVQDPAHVHDAVPRLERLRIRGAGAGPGHRGHQARRERCRSRRLVHGRFHPALHHSPASSRRFSRSGLQYGPGHSIHQSSPRRPRSSASDRPHWARRMAGCRVGELAVRVQQGIPQGGAHGHLAQDGPDPGQGHLGPGPGGAGKHQQEPVPAQVHQQVHARAGSGQRCSPAFRPGPSDMDQATRAMTSCRRRACTRLDWHQNSR